MGICVLLGIKELLESLLQIYHNIVKVAITSFLCLGFGVVYVYEELYIIYVSTLGNNKLFICYNKKYSLEGRNIMFDKYEWIRRIDTYFSIVERINEHFNKLRKSMNIDEIEDEMFYFCVEILRLVPFKGKDELVLIEEDGICLFKEDISFLMDDLDEILQKNKEEFEKIKRIRNKYEHEPHNIKTVFSTSSGASSGIGFYYKDTLISFHTNWFTYIIYDLNKLIKKIQEYIYMVEKEHGDEFDSFTKEYLPIIKNRKNIEYNKMYTRLPRVINSN